MADLSSIDAVVSRVLVVENDQDEIDFIKTFLEHKKMFVDIARDAGQARAAFKMHQPDFVIMDVMLPNEVTGFELCERLKQENINIPMLMLTAVDMDDARDLAMRVGADGYMTKPYDPEELLRQMFEIAEKCWRRKFGESVVEEEKISFICTECNKKLRVKASHRGRTLNCPRCGQPVMIPFHG